MRFALRLLSLFFVVTLRTVILLTRFAFTGAVLLLCFFSPLAGAIAFHAGHSQRRSCRSDR
jgi:hypothetical protein